MLSRSRWSCVAGVLALLVAMSTVVGAAPAYKTQHVFIVVMDGVRWMDTFGDPTHVNIPHLYNDLRPQGTLFTNYYDRGVTVTRQGHSTIISGTWQKVLNGGPRLTRPTLFEYYRDEKGAPPAKCWSVFGKAEYSFLPYSSEPAYGSGFAGQHLSGGGANNPVNELSAQGDVGVLNKVLDVMKTDQPDIVFINFGYTDHAGHVAKDISEYQAAIKNCDEQMWKLWDAIQADPHYQNTTTAFFTNDHGRHTTDFHSHGDQCNGCEHIMLLVLGPDINKDTVVDKEALQIDIAPTAAELLGLQTPLSTGRVLTECLTQYLALNQKEARTDTARKAVAIEKLADRDLLKVAADYVLASSKPETVPATLEGELLVRGLLRAYNVKQDQRYLAFVQAWIAAHKTPGAGGLPVALGNVILELPPEVRQGNMALARQVGDQAKETARRPGEIQRTSELSRGAFLGRLTEVTKEPSYAEAGRQLLTAALALPGPKAADALASARELVLLGQAAAAYPTDDAITKAFILAAFRALRTMKENGALWDDRTVSALNLYGVQASTRGRVLRDFGRATGPNATLPASVQAMTEQELRPLFPNLPKAPLPNLQRQIVNLVNQRAKQCMPFSIDMLRYGVNEAGAYADGSPTAQGGFLLAYTPLPWRYGGDPWAGSPNPPVRTPG